MVPVIGIPVLNRFDLLTRAINSIDFPVEKLVIIDNSGEHNDIPVNRHVKSLFVLRMPSNLGVATSWNLVIKSVPRAAGWILLNSDAWYEPGALENFYSTCDENEIQLSGVPPWCNLWVGRKVVERIGLFSEAYHPAYMEDIDYDYRAKAAGVTIMMSDANICHDNSATISSDGRLREMNQKSHRANVRLHDVRVMEGTLREASWDIVRRCEYGFD